MGWVRILERMPRFVVQIAFTDFDARAAAKPAHREYLKDLFAQGKLVTSGPWADQSGALLIYEVRDEAQLREIVAKDPYMLVNVGEVTVMKEWTPIFS